MDGKRGVKGGIVVTVLNCAYYGTLLVRVNGSRTQLNLPMYARITVDKAVV